jgi:hypothetical protein
MLKIPFKDMINSCIGSGEIPHRNFLCGELDTGVIGDKTTNRTDGYCARQA